MRNWSWLREADVVHCHMTISAVIGTAIFELKRLVGSKTPLVVETYHAVGMPIPKLNRRVHAWLAKRRDALALMARDPFWDAFLDRNTRLASAVIPNGISWPAGPPVAAAERLGHPRELGIPDTCRFVVGTVGRLQAERRPWIYPRIFKFIADRLGPDVHFIIGGAGPEADRVKAEIDAVGLAGRIHMIGLVKDPARVYSALDLYLTLNVGSVTGVAALEAAFAGVPILAVQLLDDYRPGPLDWIWSSQDLSAVAARAADLVEDPAALEALGHAQQDHARSHHTVEGMARSYQNLYQAALARKGPHQTTPARGRD
jgi:glycosyltransferase involved in cell wall biosynthesis